MRPAISPPVAHCRLDPGAPPPAHASTPGALIKAAVRSACSNETAPGVEAPRAVVPETFAEKTDMQTVSQPAALPVDTAAAVDAAHNAVTEARFRAMFAWFGNMPLADIDAHLLAHAQFPLIAGGLREGKGGAACN